MASANALALSNRSAGNRSSALASAAATFAGTDCRWVVTVRHRLGHNLHDDRLRGRAVCAAASRQHFVEHTASE
jgi:hypothetical protein